jgi:hypothetical protein
MPDDVPTTLRARCPLATRSRRVPRPRHVPDMRTSSLRRLAMLAVATTLVVPARARAQDMAALIARVNAAEDSGHHAKAAVLMRQIWDISGGDPIPLYMTARQLALAGQRDRAMTALRQAIGDGVVAPYPIDRDTNFTVLRAHRGWAALVRQQARATAARDTALRRELLELAERDQAGRAGIDSVLRRFGVPSPQADSAFARMAAIDSPVQARLRAIIAARGWLGRRLVGDDASHAVWLVTQHMSAAEQRTLLPLLRKATQAGDARPADLALLEDRVATEDGGLQRYGSQLMPPKPGEPPALYPIDRPECVDRRRKAVKLPPIATYLEHFGAKWEAPTKRCSA